MARTQQLANTDARLRELLQNIFASSDLYTFEELVSDISQCLEFEPHLLTYIREKSWFRTDGDHLKFPYLSFEYDAGRAIRFQDKEKLVSRERELLQDGFESRSSDRCVIVYKADSDLDMNRVVNLLMRIMVAFYINCGSHDHFRQSVASRFVREYFKASPSDDVNTLLTFVESRIGLKVSLWQPRDSIYFSEHLGLPAEDLLKPFPGLQRAPLELFQDTGFTRNLRTSVARKNQTSGALANRPGCHYVINTFLANRISGKERDPWSSYKVRQKAVAIFEPLGDVRISLDAVFHACQVIEKYIEAFDDVRTSNVIMNADRRCLEVETQVAEQPLTTYSEFFDLLAQTLSLTLDEVASITQAGAIVLWLHDPFRDALVPKMARYYDEKFRDVGDALCVARTGEEHVASVCFATGTGTSLYHPTWISNAKFFARKQGGEDRDERLSKLQRDQDKREKLRNSAQCQDCACLALPVRRGRIALGVVEIVSAAVGQLTIDTMLLEKLAAICGDTLRRIELANDRAWLARMSFVHACRHRIENLLRQLEDGGGKVGIELTELIRYANYESAVVPDKDLKQHSLDRIRRSLSTVSSGNEIQKWLGQFESATKSLNSDDVAFDCVADILETLVSNNSHSDFHLDALSVAFQSGGHFSSPHIEIKYEPDEVWIQESRLSRIGFSPIPSESSLTFHYGLFLLAAEIRMLGGFVLPKLEFDDLENGLFGLTFQVPANNRRGQKP